MTLNISALRQDFSARSVGTGVAAALVITALAGGFLWVRGPATQAAIEKKLASQTVIVERSGFSDETEEEAQDLAADDSAMPEESTPAEAETPVAADAAAHEEETHAEETHAATATEPQPTINNTPITLAKAPLDGLYEDTTEGRLPVIRAADRMTPFTAYLRPFTATDTTKPLVSIVITGIGLSETASKAVISEISPEVSIAVSPYANAPDVWINEARATGHEAWMTLPVEPDLYPMDDSGPQTLLINAVERQNINKLHWAMSRASGYAGFVTGQNTAFMKSAHDVRPVVHEIYKRGLGFVDGDPAPSTTAASVAMGVNGAYAANNVWIDAPATAEHIAASLRQLEILAQSNGTAIGFISSTPMGLKMLQQWIDGLPQKGIVIAPLSALASPSAATPAPAFSGSVLEESAEPVPAAPVTVEPPAAH